MKRSRTFAFASAAAPLIYAQEMINSTVHARFSKDVTVHLRLRSLEEIQAIEMKNNVDAAMGRAQRQNFVDRLGAGSAGVAAGIATYKAFDRWATRSAERIQRDYAVREIVQLRTMADYSPSSMAKGRASFRLKKLLEVYPDLDFIRDSEAAYQEIYEKFGERLSIDGDGRTFLLQVAHTRLPIFASDAIRRAMVQQKLVEELRFQLQQMALSQSEKAAQFFESLSDGSTTFRSTFQIIHRSFDRRIIEVQLRAEAYPRIALTAMQAGSVNEVRLENLLHYLSTPESIREISWWESMVERAVKMFPARIAGGKVEIPWNFRFGSRDRVILDALARRIVPTNSMEGRFLSHLSPHLLSVRGELLEAMGLPAKTGPAVAFHTIPEEAWKREPIAAGGIVALAAYLALDHFLLPDRGRELLADPAVLPYHPWNPRNPNALRQDFIEKVLERVRIQCRPGEKCFVDVPVLFDTVPIMERWWKEEGISSDVH